MNARLLARMVLRESMARRFGRMLCTKSMSVSEEVLIFDLQLDLPGQGAVPSQTALSRHMVLGA